MYVPPWSILAGLGALTRQEISLLLPHFEDTSLHNLAADKLRDVAIKLGGSEAVPAEAAFRRRLVQASEKVMASDATDRALRVRLWVHLLSTFDIDTRLPLSTRAANACSATLAHCAAGSLSLETEEEAGSSMLREARKRLLARFSRATPDFSEVVIAQADLVARAVANAAQEGTLAADDQAELVRRVRAQIEQLPPELRSGAMEQALKSGDTAIISLLASGTSLLGVGIVVKLAGFSAYIFAAQAAAIIPFIGGTTAVSMLFVLANPLFIGPVILLGAYLAGQRVRGAHGKRLASNLAVQLALRGIAFGRGGLRQTLDDFKSLSAGDVAALPLERQSGMLAKLSAVKAAIGDPLPPTPWPPEGVLARQAGNGNKSPLETLLFQKGSGNVREALIVAGLTAGDILYNAAAIDPTVLRAADFSSSDDIPGVADFGVFSDRFETMAAEAVDGAANNLRGYLAEQIVAS